MARHGTPEKLREGIAERLWFVAVLGEIGIRQAEIGDDVGLNYSIRRIVASMRVAIATATDLAEQFPPPPESRDAQTWTTEE